MSEDPKGAGDNASEVSPGAGFQVFVDMANLQNKLKLLNYDDDYVLKWRMKPISRIHFAVQSNPGDQLHAFIALCAWLFQKCAVRFERPSEDDDQSVLLQNILIQFKKLGHETTISPSKLRSGSGESVVEILNSLADDALKRTSFSWQLPEKPDELFDNDETNQKDDDNEIDMNKIDEDMFNKDGDIDEYEEDDAVLNVEALTKLGIRSTSNILSNVNDNELRPESIIESTTDATEWKLEVERILPQLKVTFKSEGKDWRTRQEQRMNYKSQIASSLKDAESMLIRFHGDIDKSLEKIGTRETYINSQLTETLHRFYGQQDVLAEVKAQHRHRSTGINDKSQELTRITSDLSRIKEEMEETGQNVTDGGPLVKIKKAIEELNRDIVRVDVRIAVLEHTLMQSKVREKEEANDDRQNLVVNDLELE